MNWLGLLAVALGLGAYFLGVRCARYALSAASTSMIVIALAILALPALTYAIYYSGLLGEPIWLYRLRALPGTELLASLAGLMAGWVQARLVPRLQLSKVGRRVLVPVSLGFTLALPHLKPVLRPFDYGVLQENWEGDACLQSTQSTCGPAAAATIVRRLGGALSERDLARESFTCRSGTENWYLARTLRRHAFRADFDFSTPDRAAIPAIAGVRLKSLGNSGHFVALLGRRSDALVIADPLEGVSTNTLAVWEAIYEFTGFLLVVQKEEPRP